MDKTITITRLEVAAENLIGIAGKYLLIDKEGIVECFDLESGDSKETNIPSDIDSVVDEWGNRGLEVFDNMEQAESAINKTSAKTFRAAYGRLVITVRDGEPVYSRELSRPDLVVDFFKSIRDRLKD